MAPASCTCSVVPNVCAGAHAAKCCDEEFSSSFYPSSLHNHSALVNIWRGEEGTIRRGRIMGDKMDEAEVEHGMKGGLTEEGTMGGGKVDGERGKGGRL
eukprot:3386855-Pyramimonas_sp.AAC.1